MRSKIGSFRSINKQFVVASLALALALIAFATSALAQTSAPSGPMTVPSGQVEQPANGGVNWQGVGYGVATVGADIFYVPAKFLYAFSGGLVGGGAYLLTGGNMQTANTIWRSSLGGDYVVTPDMIAGKEPVHFSGPTTTAPVASQTTVQPIATIPPSNSSPMDSGAGTTSSAGAVTTAASR